MNIEEAIEKIVGKPYEITDRRNKTFFHYNSQLEPSEIIRETYARFKDIQASMKSHRTRILYKQNDKYLNFIIHH